MSKEHVALAVLILMLVAVGLVLSSNSSPSSPPSEEELENVPNFLNPGEYYYDIVIRSKEQPQETHTLEGVFSKFPVVRSKERFSLEATYEYRVNETVEKERRYETRLDDEDLTMRVSDSGEETVSGVSRDDLGKKFSVSIGNRTEWRFTSYEDELHSILNSTKNVEAGAPRPIVISFDTNRTEVAAYLNRLQEGTTGMAFVRVSPGNIEEYTAEFRRGENNYARLYVAAETKKWKLESILNTNSDRNSENP